MDIRDMETLESRATEILLQLWVEYGHPPLGSGNLDFGLQRIRW